MEKRQLTGLGITKLAAKIGIGYFNEKLVEFMVSKDGNTQYEEITLIQSLDWFEKCTTPPRLPRHQLLMTGVHFAGLETWQQP